MFVRRRVFIERTTTVNVVQRTSNGSVSLTETVRSGVYGTLTDIHDVERVLPQLNAFTASVLKQQLLQAAYEATSSTPLIERKR